MNKLIDECLVVLRISTKNKKVKDEIKSLINACIADLKISGVDKEKMLEDHLLNRAIKMYVKANFNTLSKDSERLMEAYEHLKISLALSGDYRGVNEE